MGSLTRDLKDPSINPILYGIYLNPVPFLHNSVPPTSPRKYLDLDRGKYRLKLPNSKIQNIKDYVPSSKKTISSNHYWFDPRSMILSKDPERICSFHQHINGGTIHSAKQSRGLNLPNNQPTTNQPTTDQPTNEVRGQRFGLQDPQTNDIRQIFDPYPPTGYYDLIDQSVRVTLTTLFKMISKTFEDNL